MIADALQSPVQKIQSFEKDDGDDDTIDIGKFAYFT